VRSRPAARARRRPWRAGGVDLARHPAAAEPGAARPADGQRGEVLRPADPLDQPRPRPARIAVVEPVDVGQQHQRVRPDEVRDERGQPVVVAEPDLLRGDGVVLVHDRDDAERQQPVEGGLRVAVVRAAHDVVGGEQHLADGPAVPGEGRRVPLHEQHLPDRRRCLLRREVAGPTGQPQRRQPGGDRPGRDEHELAAALRQGVDEGVEPGGVEPAERGRQ
jgi:hypothetical protein